MTMRAMSLLTIIFSRLMQRKDKHITSFNFTDRENRLCNIYIESLLYILSCQDAKTEEHTRRVTAMALSFANLWNLPKEKSIYLRYGAQLHDIGKAKIPGTILYKNGPLTDIERVIIQKHPIYAFELLHPVSCLHPALDIPYYHQEKWDGSGYPRRLRGRQIPFTARLFAIVDVWDALLSDRPYHLALTKDEALSYIHKQSGRHFDPEIVRMFSIFLKSNHEFKSVNSLSTFDHLSNIKKNSPWIH